MRVLGLSSNYHDASASLVVDGEVVFSAAEERYSRQKHDPTFPSHSIRACLAAGGITADDLDYVAYHEDPVTKLSRTLATSLSRWPMSFPTFFKSAKEAVTSGLWIKADISNALGISPKKVVYAPHHMSHAAHAFLTSPFSDAAVMTLDAVGEWTSSALFKARHVDGRMEMEAVDVSPFPHSVGLFYSAFTSFLGFKVNDGECSTMALASYGQPRFVEEVSRVLRIQADGSHELDLDYFDFRGDTDIPVTEKLVKVFGQPRHFKEPLAYSAMAALGEGDHYADIAASVQAVTESAVLAWAQRALEVTGAPALCYAGGVALNCVANQRLLEAVPRLYIPPDPGDGGGAMGAALLVHDKVDGSKTPSRISPFCGGRTDEDDVPSLLEHLEPEKWHTFTRLGVDRLEPGQVKLKELSETGLVEEVTRRLERGEVVGWCQGRFENGPRALGGRSILARPDRVDVAERMSARIKLRAPFRPYAASMTEAEAARSLVDPVHGLHRWMQASARVADDAFVDLRAACHANGTTRPQVVDGAEVPLYERLLQACGQAWGREAVLNTSFNERGMPMVGDAVHALLSFARTDLDAVAIGPMLIYKNRA